MNASLLKICTMASFVISIPSVYVYAEGLQNPLAVDSISGLIQKFVEIFSYFVIILAVLALIWVGNQFVLAQGKPDRLKELKTWLAYIMIGVAIVVGAQIMINIIINTLAATGVVNQDTLNAIQGGDVR